MVVDDHPMVRSGIQTMLLAYDNMELIAQAGNGTEAVEICARARPDVVLMDIMLGEMDGIDVLRKIREDIPGMKIIILSNYHDSSSVVRALEAGAIGYLTKAATANELAKAIRDAHEDKPTLSSEAVFALQNNLRTIDSPKLKLTRREIEILQLLARGLNTPQISHTLHTSPSTTRFHIANILRKFNVANRMQAVAHAIEQGIL